MQNKGLLQAPPALLVLAVVGILGILTSRGASKSEAIPAFSSPLEKDIVYVEVGGDAVPPGVYQINDAYGSFGVIKLTDVSSHTILDVEVPLASPLHSGESLTLVKKGRKINFIRSGWMNASRRIAMGVPLHPDRMSQLDWVVLPGIGETLAERIETNRQNYGEFEDLKELARVKGVGKKRIERWREFF